MKRIYLVLLVFIIVKLNAENFQISFLGKGASLIVDSVKVENLSSNVTLMLKGSDILNLTNNNGFNLINLNSSNKLCINPNPVTGSCLIEFNATAQGKVSIELFDIKGRSLYRLEEMLAKAKHTYRLCGLTTGIFIIKVNAEAYSYTSRIISYRVSDLNIELKHIELKQPDKNSDNNSDNNISAMYKSSKSIIDMLYIPGSLLKFTGYGGMHRSVLMLTPDKSQEISFDFVACTDKEHHNYATVKIGEHFWMAENLNTGKRIDGVINQTNDEEIEKYCRMNDEYYCNIYGGLYQWEEMMQYVPKEKVRGICPLGWHIPSHDEWSILERAICSSSSCETDFPFDTISVGWRGNYEGGSLKSTDINIWEKPNIDATNISGFNAIPGGYRDFSSGFIVFAGYSAIWWSSSQKDNTTAWDRTLYHKYS
ncbi:MAG: T9SS type A sorting domain-containing protein, partial [Bacteroidales bacterium]|nr:T9SS type A sorting domain-containing protein [Bacteroidales bacterium]